MQDTAKISNLSFDIKHRRVKLSKQHWSLMVLLKKYIYRIDNIVNHYKQILFNHVSVQTLRHNWYGVYFLLNNIEETNIKIKILSATTEQFVEDIQSNPDFEYSDLNYLIGRTHFEQAGESPIGLILLTLNNIPMNNYLLCYLEKMMAAVFSYMIIKSAHEYKINSKHFQFLHLHDEKEMFAFKESYLTTAFLNILYCCYLFQIFGWFEYQEVQYPKIVEEKSAWSNKGPPGFLEQLYMLCACRIGHYVKAMMRDKLGGQIDCSQIKGSLDTWLQLYTAPEYEAQENYSYKFPLQYSYTNIHQIPGCNKFLCVLEIIPNGFSGESFKQPKLITEINTSCP